MLKNIRFTCRLSREDDTIVALCPEFNVSSFADMPEEALASLHEAVTLFLEECQRMGTLETVLEEAGYRLTETRARNVPVAHIRTNMTTAGMSRDRYFELLEQVK